MVSDSGNFWRLQHDHLAAALHRHDLTGEQLRVYLALAGLTHGYGKQQDTVSLSQIAEYAGGLRRPHVVRALDALAAKGLYRQMQGKGQSVTRWVAWPPPAAAEAETGAKADDSTVPASGNTPVTTQGNTPVPTGGTSAVTEAVTNPGNTPVPTEGSRTVPKAVPTLGTHQDTKNLKKDNISHPADSPTPDSRVKTFLDFFTEAYQSALGRPYLVNGGRDGATVKRPLRSLDALNVDALPELQQAARNMLSDPWGRQRADIGLLAGKINSWRGKSQPTFTEDPQALANGRRLAAERASA